MVTFIVKRFLQLIPVLVGVSIIVFFLMRVCAADPAPIVLGQHATEESITEWRDANGLNDPVVVQYVSFIKGAVTGDLGTSYYSKSSVSKEILSRFPATIELAISAIVFASILGIVIGVISAVKKNSIFDTGGMVFSLVGVSMPIFWLGILLIILFAGVLHILPSSGRIDPVLKPNTVTGFILIDSLLEGIQAAFFDGVKHLVLPTVALSLYSMAIIARMTRSSMLETLQAGLRPDSKSKRNQRKPRDSPTCTEKCLYAGGNCDWIATGKSAWWSGTNRIGLFLAGNRFVYRKLYLKSDFPVVQGVVLLIAVIFVCMNLIVDLSMRF